ncbi:MAG: hypothetical protein MK142_00130 [Pseudomonadales bacterium]|nr:hypothetical protein [Pseudomonadales bacterium]
MSRRSVFEHMPELLAEAACADAMRACVVRKAPQRATECVLWFVTLKGENA